MLFRYRRLQGEGVELVAHPPAQRLVNHLMLLDAGHARELAGGDMGGIVIAIAAQILDDDDGARQGLLDQALDLHRVHRHRSLLPT